MIYKYQIAETANYVDAIKYDPKLLSKIEFLVGEKLDIRCTFAVRDYIRYKIKFGNNEVHIIYPGDYFVKNNKGLWYGCPKEIFKENYKKVKNQ